MLQHQSAVRKKAREIRAANGGMGFISLSRLATVLGYKDRRTAKKWLSGRNVARVNIGRHYVYDVHDIAKEVVMEEYGK